MLDIKFIRENLEKVREGILKKGSKVDVQKILSLDKERRELVKKIDDLRSRQKGFSGKSDEAAQVKIAIQELETKLKHIEAKFSKAMYELPNLPLPDVPFGKDERDNVVLREVGEKRNFGWEPRNYLELAESLDLIDVGRAAKVSGSRFGYLKREAALLEFALVNFALETAVNDGFIPIVPPVMIKPEAMRGMGYIDTDSDVAERYFFEKDKLFLVGTSEQAIGPMHSDEIFSEDELPKRYIGFSSCFREEAGSYGKDTKGILRVHQFDKVEMFSFTRPEDSKKEHELILGLEEKLMQLLKIPYRVVALSTGDLSRPSAATYDIESFMPGQGEYRETHSSSNCTDFQARRLNIKYKLKTQNAKFKTDFVHTLNGTAFAIGRTIIAILENYQEKDGFLKIPEVLQKYVGFDVIKR